MDIVLRGDVHVVFNSNLRPTPEIIEYEEPCTSCICSVKINFHNEWIFSWLRWWMLVWCAAFTETRYGGSNSSDSDFQSSPEWPGNMQLLGCTFRNIMKTTRNLCQLKKFVLIVQVHHLRNSRVENSLELPQNHVDGSFKKFVLPGTQVGVPIDL